jgi:CheY-like chemotaxis protein
MAIESKKPYLQEAGGGAMRRISDLKILVVDDEFLVQDNIVRSLKRLHCSDIRLAGSYEEAIRECQQEVPDIVLMDIQIPGEKDGIDLAREIFETFHCPVVYITAYSELTHGQQPGVFGYVPKPVNPDILNSIVENAVFAAESQRMPLGEQRRMAFISYSRKDRSWAERIAALLPPTIDLFIDYRIEAGMDYLNEVEKALKATKVGILLLSPSFLSSNFVRALELPPLLKATKGGARILPVFVEPVKRYDLPEELKHVLGVNEPERALSTLLPEEQDAVLEKLQGLVTRLIEPAKASSAGR